MASKLPAITLKAIGVVRSEIKRPSRGHLQDTVSEIIIDRRLTEALDNLDQFSHIIVIYWMHRRRGPAPQKVHPMGDLERPLTGVFATRSPDRPNPIGQATVRLRQRQGNRLIEAGLAVIYGTPVVVI